MLLVYHAQAAGVHRARGVCRAGALAGRVGMNPHTATPSLLKQADRIG
ncbi:MAG: hypothetical protein M3R61_16605 [Chloroflexota bacterium]|nr:hypothetical protein [Chloroflexota bacterium]